MRIGYPCVNTTITCSSAKTFRLSSYSERRFVETVENNLGCLSKILAFNLEHELLFFRITSDLIPFASHPILTFDWKGYFSTEFQRIGSFIRKHDVRISMHPDQFVVINSPNEDVLESSVKELAYHAEVLDLLGLGGTAKIQVHVGGVYGDKDASIRRFISRYAALDDAVKRRLVIENDDRLYTVSDCLRVSREVGVPVLFDTFHHKVNNSSGSVREAFERCASTWTQRDGVPMVDYSSQAPGAKKGKHTETLDAGDFRRFIGDTRGYDFDIMLEVKDKERSAIKAASIVSGDERFTAA